MTQKELGVGIFNLDQRESLFWTKKDQMRKITRFAIRVKKSKIMLRSVTRAFYAMERET